jgi:hypothetical protein
VRIIGVLAWLALVSALSAATLSNPRRVDTGFEFSIVGASNAIYAIQASSDLTNWTTVATNSLFGEVRTIQISSSAQQEFYRVRALQPLFTGALAVRESVEFAGSGVIVNSFDSRDASFFRPDGTLDPNRFRDYGDIITISTQTNTLIIGNGKVYGQLLAPVDGGAVLGPNGCVGSILWHLNGGRGIQDGWFAEGTAHVVDAELPQGHAYVTPEPGSIDGTNYTYVLSNGHYTLPELRMGSSNQVMLITGHATLYVAGSFTLGSAAKIVIVRNASLNVFVGGATATISLYGVVNERRNAAAFAYYGLPNNTNIFVAGDFFAGTIYAPGADVLVTGGGYDFLEINGAVVGRNIRVNGRAIMRYDEALGVAGPAW